MELDINRKWFSIPVEMEYGVQETSYYIFENDFGLVCKCYCGGKELFLNFDLEILANNMPPEWVNPVIEKLKELTGQ